jgi:hypothetical protein
MNRKHLAFLIPIFCFAALVLLGPDIRGAKSQNGVYFTYTGYMTTVLELKDGRFRYWFESDLKGPEEPAYPISGSYSAQGNTIILEHPQVSQPQWTFRKVDGLATLWRPDAMDMDPGKDLKSFRRYGAGGILVASSEPAPKLWEERGPPVK